MPESQHLHSAGGSVVEGVAHTIKVYAPDAARPFPVRSRADARLRSDQAERAVQLGLEEVGRGLPVLIPPIERIANLTLGARSDPNITNQLLSLEFAQQLPPVHKLTALARGDRCEQFGLLGLTEREAFIVLIWHENCDHGALRDGALWDIESPVDDPSREHLHVNRLLRVADEALTLR